tara:strand:+ start:115 stop:312 length:198 start_codon:yes stop_codon:yes gene_type:complete
MNERITIEEQIKCVEREIATRRRTFPRLVELGRMRPEMADREIAGMEAVKATLEMEANQLHLDFK